MNTIRESVPAQWSETDERFFRVVAEVFPVAFLSGASVLLASYDVESVPGTASGACDPEVSEPSHEASEVRA